MTAGFRSTEFWLAVGAFLLGGVQVAVGLVWHDPIPLVCGSVVLNSADLEWGNSERSDSDRGRAGDAGQAWDCQGGMNPKAPNEFFLLVLHKDSVARVCPGGSQHETVLAGIERRGGVQWGVQWTDYGPCVHTKEDEMIMRGALADVGILDRDKQARA